jgi:hypothetical protein
MNDQVILQPSEFGSFYSGYINHAQGKDILDSLATQVDELSAYFLDKGEEWSMKAYAPGKWTPKELLGHMIDCDRIMAYRALCIARGEQLSLPGYDQDVYMEGMDFNAVALHDLLEDLAHERKAILSMIRIWPQEAFLRIGKANDSPVSVRALLHIIVGHTEHHFQVLKERY